MNEEVEKKEITILARTTYGFTPLNGLVVDCKGQGGYSSKNDGFFEGMMFGIIAGSAS